MLGVAYVEALFTSHRPCGRMMTGGARMRLPSAWMAGAIRSILGYVRWVRALGPVKYCWFDGIDSLAVF